MSDPTRWLDDSRAPDGAASLLRAARPAKPLDAAVQARSAAKLAELVTGTAATSTATATTSVLLTSIWPKVIVGIAAIALVSASAVGLRASRTPAPRPRPVAAAPPIETAREARVSPPALPQVEPPAAAPVAAPLRPPATRSARVTREVARATAPTPPEPAASAPAPPAMLTGNVVGPETPHAIVGAPSTGERPSTLVEETELLARVSGALEPDPAEARRLLDAYRARYTRSRLAPERDYLAFEIARRQGAHDEARALGEAFLREHPRSPHASAVRARLTP
ncbi:MAG: hypothetical protein U0326_29925 [Polyangiales bacterium]